MKKKDLYLGVAIGMYIASLAALSITIDDVLMVRDMRFAIIATGLMTVLLGNIYLSLHIKESRNDHKEPF